MKLKELKDIIATDLKIVDLSTSKIYTNVCCYSDLFDSLGDKEVGSIRNDKFFVIIYII